MPSHPHPPTPLLDALVGGDIDAASFRHLEHLTVGFESVRRYRFPEALALIASALRAMAQRAGKPEAYHETITIAYLSLIAERCAGHEYSDFATFARCNPDLFDKTLLMRWYTPQRLYSDVARLTFVLPVQPA